MPRDDIRSIEAILAAVAGLPTLPYYHNDDRGLKCCAYFSENYAMIGETYSYMHRWYAFFLGEEYIGSRRPPAKKLNAYTAYRQLVSSCKPNVLAVARSYDLEEYLRSLDKDSLEDLVFQTKVYKYFYDKYSRKKKK